VKGKRETAHCTWAVVAHSCEVRDHKSLKARQEAHAVALGVVDLCRGSWSPSGAAVFRQLQRSSLSVQLKIAEGYSYGDSPTLTRYLGIAYGSAVETRELLELAVEAALAPPDRVNRLLRHACNAQQLLLGMVRARRIFHQQG
jgi:four helix bundle protein